MRFGGTTPAAQKPGMFMTIADRGDGLLYTAVRGGNGLA